MDDVSTMVSVWYVPVLRYFEFEVVQIQFDIIIINKISIINQFEYKSRRSNSLEKRKEISNLCRKVLRNDNIGERSPRSGTIMEFQTLQMFFLGGGEVGYKVKNF